MKLHFLMLLMLLCAANSAKASPLAGGAIQKLLLAQTTERLARVCPAESDALEPPNFSASSCYTESLFEVDPQGTQLWIEQIIRVSDAERAQLIGVLVSAKASSTVYLNGVFIGSNGKPSSRASDEITGAMDRVFRVPEGLLKVGDNQLIVRMSSHHGWLRLVNPIHALELVPYLHVQDQILRHYLSTLLPLGAFLLAAFYFGSVTWRSEHKARAAWLFVLSLLAAMQLLLETSRAIVAYRYPLHDLRLIAILGCTVLISICLIAILAAQYGPRSEPMDTNETEALTKDDPANLHQGIVSLLSLTALLAIAGAIIWLPGMDAKANLVLLIASLVGFAIACYGVWQRAPQARAHAAAIALFALLNVWMRGRFLDAYFFYLIALLLVFLMVQQAIAYAQEVQLQREQRARADRLQSALDEHAQPQSEVVLTILSVGKMQRIAASAIAHVKGAGDYAELHLIEGGSLLHNAGLNELEAQLPSYFLRVHRSHLVNTKVVDRLQQAEGGTGTLFLQNGMTVAVSRRIMPGVRRALK
jgi:DNA-binding LytR/AlgR family response regulator